GASRDLERAAARRTILRRRVGKPSRRRLALRPCIHRPDDKTERQHNHRSRRALSFHWSISFTLTRLRYLPKIHSATAPAPVLIVACSSPERWRGQDEWSMSASPGRALRRDPSRWPS